VQRIHEFCQVSGCGLKHKSRGYCATHYAQWHRGVTEPSQPIKTRDRSPPEFCIEPGCENKTDSKSLCKMHYARLLRHGHTKYRDRKKAPKPCTVLGCDNHIYAKGKCHLHYIQIRKVAQYGITVQRYDELLFQQNSVCAICHRPETNIDGRSLKPRMLSVDHCHDTKKVRGLLCSACNTAIGLMDHNKEILQNAAAYLVATT
jgi:hypothetical protein